MRGASESSRSGGYTFVRPPIVVVERVAGENRLAVWFRVNRALPRARCDRFCRQEGLGPRTLAAVSLSRGGTDSDQAGIVRRDSRRGTFCYQQDIADFPRGSALTRARPGRLVTVRLTIRKVKRPVKQQVRLTKPLPSTSEHVGVEYERALDCGGERAASTPR